MKWMIGPLVGLLAGTGAAAQPLPPLLDQTFPVTAPSLHAQMKIFVLPAAKQQLSISSLPGHRHPGEVLVFVLEGMVRSKLDDGPDLLYSSGQSWFEKPGQLHRILNPDPNANAKLLVVTIDPVHDK